MESLLTETMPRQSFDIFQEMKEHEQVLFCNDPSTGLQAIIAIHDTTLGPALGGCRMYPYASTEEALKDALRLAKGMTQKNAAADLDFGGGKAVIIGDPRKDKTPEMFRAFGQYVASLNGRFYTGTDMGTTMDDFVHALKETECIVGVPEVYGGNGDSSIPTAQGVINSIKAVTEVLFGDSELTGRTYAIQGLGKVGFKVAKMLIESGNDLYVSDIFEEPIQAIKDLANKHNRRVEVLQAEEIYKADADIFVPCATGGILNDETIPELRVKAVVGSANNQLAEDRHGEMLHEKGILYAPDFIVNSGGLIQVADELYGGNKERVLKKTKAIYDAILTVLQQSKEQQIPTLVVANEMCEERIRKRTHRNNFFVPQLQPKWKVRK